MDASGTRGVRDRALAAGTDMADTEGPRPAEGRPAEGRKGRRADGHWSAMLQRLPLLFALGLCAGAPAAPRAQDDPRSAAPAVRFAVPLDGGRLALADLGSGLLEACGLDAGAVELPNATVDLRGRAGRWSLVAARHLLRDAVSFRLDLPADRLWVTVDREHARALRREVRTLLARLAGRLAGAEVDSRHYELALPEGLAEGSLLTVLVHGMESGPDVWSDLQPWLQQRGFATATFAYPDDESVDRVAAELAARLAALRERPVALVGHSMGGLVARAVAEDPALAPGNVRTLVLLGVPNRGSNLAGLRFGLEVADVLRTAGDGPFGRALLEAWLAHLRDGLGEAGGDLLPGSVLLQELAARPRNPRVDYHLVLGTRSLLTPAQLARLREQVAAPLAEGQLGRTGRLVQPLVEQWLHDLDELVDGRGDGAVSVERGRLPGVEPVLVPFDHQGLVRRRGLLGAVAPDAEHPVFAQVAEWLDAARTAREPGPRCTR